MGLKYPSDLAAWQKWQSSSKPERLLKQKLELATGFAAGLVGGTVSVQERVESLVGILHTRGEQPQLLVVLDSTSPTSLKSLIEPLKYLRDRDLAVWAPQDVSDLLPGEGWEAQPVAEQELGEKLPELKICLALGHFLPWSAAAYQLAQKQGLRFIVAQHGLLTPYAPPLPAGSTLLAFSQADADFWISGRTDVDYQVVGSQMFWEASQKPAVPAHKIQDKAPIFLGQMHGAELPRSSFVYASLKFVRENQAIYRPHPSEKDKISRLIHTLMVKLGVEIDSSSQPLNQVTNPVVSIFSTGVLEAALRGVPAWVYHANPPAWLLEFWQRYGMNRWGNAPTPAPEVPEQEPAQKIAEILTQLLEK